MKRGLSILLAGPSLVALATTAAAQPAATPAAAQSADPATVAQEVNEAAQQAGDEGAIIITARRRAESLLDVPQTVNAVTSKDLQDFNVLDFEDISTLVSGLTLDSDSSGFNATAQTRGIQFQVTSQGTPTMEMYINEVPVEPNNMFQGQFDVGQIEVLKGPQGTLRGRSAPSGAMTLTTRRPDLNEFGGSVGFVADSHGGINIQAAMGVPIIQDVLAIRVAGLMDHNDAGGIKSANSPVNPRGSTNAFRATLRFEPTDNISAVVMYQRLNRKIHDYGGILFGNGALGNNLAAAPGNATDNPAIPGNQPCGPINGTTCVALAGGFPAVFAPPGFNGPVLTPGDRMNIQDFIGFTRQDSDIFTGQLDWRFAGQKLSYVGSYQDFDVVTTSDADANNTVIGVRRKTSFGSDSEERRKTHELRLSSDERLFGMLDYTAGAYYGKYYGLSGTITTNAVLMQGAFGSPLGASSVAPGRLTPFTYDPRYVVGFANLTPRENVEKSIFGSLMLHLFGDTTEVSLGGRKIWLDQTKEVTPQGIAGLAAVVNPFGLGPCPANLTGATGAGTVVNGQVVGSTYPGTCDVVVNLGNGAPVVSSLVRPIPESTRKFSPFVWNASISHKITPDLMVYASYGTAWRPGPGPITAAPVCAADVTPAVSLPAGQDPDQCDRFNFLDPDKSKAIELGFKAAFLDRRLNVAVAVFKQKFSALFIRGDGPAITLTGDCTTPGTSNSQTGGCSISGNSTFTYGAPAKTKGIDIDTSFRVNDDLNLGALFSWAKSRFTASEIPCRDTNLDGVADSGTTPNNPAAWIALGAPYGPTLCTAAGEPATFAPPWNATLRGEYSHEVFAGGRAFIRALFNYYPKNKNRPDAVSVDSTPATQVPPKAYGILNLYAGIRADDGAWEFTISGRNILNNKTILSRGLEQGTLISPQRFGATAIHFSPLANQNSGYRSISFVDRREFSVSARFAFGSR